jgi:hypothetical protein
MTSKVQQGTLEPETGIGKCKYFGKFETNFHRKWYLPEALDLYAALIWVQEMGAEGLLQTRTCWILPVRGGGATVGHHQAPPRQLQHLG